MLVDEDGRKLGVFLTRDAIEYARDKKRDLIEVAPQARPPVCRVGDYGKLKYERKKRKAEQRRRRQSSQLKEIKVRPKTDTHDLNVKVRNARRFLEDGHRVKVTVRFRGREHAHHDIGARRCIEVARHVKDVASIEQHPQMEGRQMSMLLSPDTPAG